MELEKTRVDDLIPYHNNPRHNEGAIEYVAESIREFGFKVPIVVDKDNVIVAGHTRLEASKLLGIETVPVIRADDLTEEQVKAYRLADNKVSEFAEWDEEKLEIEMNGINLKMEQFGFSELMNEIDPPENPYTDRIEAPFYEPTGEEVFLSDLYDSEKRDVLVNEVTRSDIPEDVKEFLIRAAERHTVFNYKKIAEYYSNADEEVQDLMEKSALVIIDFDDAIKNGYVKLSEGLQGLVVEDEI